MFLEEIFARSSFASRREDSSVVRMSGGDRLDFLQRISSQKFLKTKVGDVLPTAFLSGKGGLLVLAQAWIREDEILFICEPNKAARLLQLFEQFHFSEEIQFSEATEWAAIELFGTAWATSKSFDPLAAQKETSGLDTFRLMPGDSGRPDHWIYLFSKTHHVISDPKTGNWINNEERNILRASLGLPNDRTGRNEETVLLEYNLDHFVHRNKGCYPGQEVMERIYTYGNVARVGVLLKPKNTNEIDLSTYSMSYSCDLVAVDDSSRNGRLHSVCSLDFLEAKPHVPLVLGFATLPRLSLRSHDFRDDRNQVWSLEASSIEFLEARQKNR